jgi:hypothetical protein
VLDQLVDWAADRVALVDQLAVGAGNR